MKIDELNKKASEKILKSNIEKAARDFKKFDELASEEEQCESSGRYHGFKEGIKWYRDQLKNNI